MDPESDRPVHGMWFDTDEHGNPYLGVLFEPRQRHYDLVKMGMYPECVLIDSGCMACVQGRHPNLGEGDFAEAELSDVFTFPKGLEVHDRKVIYVRRRPNLRLVTEDTGTDG